MAKVTTFDVLDVKLVTPSRFGDARGHFSETFNQDHFRREVADLLFVQDNQSLSRPKGTVRGLHFQRPDKAQGKLVRVLRGAIVDVAVDARHGSPTYGQHVSVRLDADVGAQLWVPPGFLHGFCTLEDDTEVFYKVTDFYSAQHDGGVLWNDPDLKIDWPVGPDGVTLSDKDKALPRLKDLEQIFTYSGDGA